MVCLGVIFYFYIFMHEAFWWVSVCLTVCIYFNSDGWVSVTAFSR